MIDVFPDYCPKSLKDRYLEKEQSIKALGDGHKYIEAVKIRQATLCRLIYDERMKKVWVELKKHSKTIERSLKFPELDGFSNMASRLKSNIDQALRETRVSFKTRTEEAQRYQEIAKKARELQRMVNGSLLDDTAYEWFSNEAINVILEHDIKLEKAVGTFCLIVDIDDDNKKGNIFSSNMMLRRGEVEPKIQYWNTHKDTKDWFSREVMTPQYPTMHQILNNMAGDADVLAKDALNRDRICVHNDTSRETIFIRSLYTRFWREEFGSPLYGTLATLCNVVLGNDPCTTRIVQDALRTKKGGGWV